MLKKNVQTGVSVIEAMVVVALIVILVLLALPMANEWLANSRIRVAAEGMLAGLQMARAEAVRRNDLVEFRLDGGAGWAVRSSDGSTIQTRAATEGTADVVITTLPNNASRVTFDGLGRRSNNLDGTAPIERILIDLPAAVLSPENSRDLRIDIGVGGQVLLCDPAVVDANDVRKCP